MMIMMPMTIEEYQAKKAALHDKWIFDEITDSEYEEGLAILDKKFISEKKDAN